MTAVFLLSAAIAVIGEGDGAAYSDVSPDAWFAEYVNAVSERGIRKEEETENSTPRAA